MTDGVSSSPGRMRRRPRRRGRDAVDATDAADHPSGRRRRRRRESSQQLVRRPIRVDLLPRGRPAGRPGRRRARLRPPTGGVHRDIKPPNLLLDAQGNVWVTDFGLAKLVEGDELSQSHDLVGTLRFMAPERFRGVTSPLRRRLLAGRDALRAAHLAAGVRRAGPGPAHRPDHPRVAGRPCGSTIVASPATWRRWCSRRWPRTPRTGSPRRPSCGDELRRYLESRPIRSRPVGPVERLWRWCKRSPGLAAAALLTTLLAISTTIATCILYVQRDQIGQQRDQISDALIKAQNSETGAIKARTESRLQLFEALEARAMRAGGSAIGWGSGSTAWTPWPRRLRSPGS